MPKTILNNCEATDKCILEIDGKYFGYDTDPAYPESLFTDKSKAYEFKTPSEAFAITTWHSGEKFVLIPVKPDIKWHTLEQLKDMLIIQGEDGNWNHDSYMHGMYNGMEYAISFLEGRDPDYKSPPPVWLANRNSQVTPVHSEKIGDDELYVIPFQEEFCQKIHTIFYVNRDTQGTHGSNTVSSQKCPHCGSRHIFKVFDEKDSREFRGYAYELYDCRCPSCRKEFEFEIEFEL